MPAHSEPADAVAAPRAAIPPNTLNTLRTFPVYPDLAAWERRRAQIRQQILISCGLYPMPPKTPLKARVFGKVERDGYTIEKVAIQTYPGFYLAGNLYRPHHAGAETETRTHPGVLIAHGHWAEGRMANGPDGSIPARAITFARQGYVAFTYDMVGYNDTHQIPHTFAGDRKHWLWGVSLMGLQTWNSIRALDFLSSLPDVDRSKLAITGESGGGTQTMILGAIDDRLAAVGPCVMVSHSMQGGCLCENAPGLRVDFSNMEVAACAAPKPQIMVGASGDWTRTMMTIEGPGVESIYKLYGKPENLQYVLFNYNHNINQTSREAVYAAFGKWLLGSTDPALGQEPPYKMEAVADLRVFPDGQPMPVDALSADALTEALKRNATEQVEKLKPHNRPSLSSFQKTFLPAWKQTLDLDLPNPATVRNVSAETNANTDAYMRSPVSIDYPGGRGPIPGQLFVPRGKPPIGAIVLVDPGGMQTFLETNGADGEAPGPLVSGLLADGNAVLLIDCFLTGKLADPKVETARHVPFGQFFETYNHTDLQERVQDLVTATAYLRGRYKLPVTLVGTGRAGLWSLLAAPAADAVAADTDQCDLTTDDALLTDDMYCPCLRHCGDFRTAMTLAAPHPLALFHVDPKFTAAAWVRDVYGALGDQSNLHTMTDPMDASLLRAWLRKNLRMEGKH